MGLSLGLGIGFCCLGIGFGFGFELVALEVGGVIRLLNSGGEWCVMCWVARQWLWMAKREMGRNQFFFFFFFKEREETEIRERGEIDCFFILCN